MTARIGNVVELKPFSVWWEARNYPGASFSMGARRVYGQDERDAAARAPKLIAKDWQIPEGAIVVVMVEQAPPAP